MSEPIFNLSSRKLNEVEKSALRKGLKYGIKSKRVDTFEILARFEELAETLDPLTIADLSDASGYQADVNGKSNCFRQLQVL
jgi:hypothetical protein